MSKDETFSTDGTQESDTEEKVDPEHTPELVTPTPEPAPTDVLKKGALASLFMRLAFQGSPQTTKLGKVTDEGILLEHAMKNMLNTLQNYKQREVALIDTIKLLHESNMNAGKKPTTYHDKLVQQLMLIIQLYANEAVHFIHGQDGKDGTNGYDGAAGDNGADCICMGRDEKP